MLCKIWNIYIMSRLHILIDYILQEQLTTVLLEMRWYYDWQNNAVKNTSLSLGTHSINNSVKKNKGFQIHLLFARVEIGWNTGVPLKNAALCSCRNYQQLGELFPQQLKKYLYRWGNKKIKIPGHCSKIELCSKSWTSWVEKTKN